MRPLKYFKINRLNQAYLQFFLILMSCFSLSWFLSAIYEEYCFLHSSILHEKHLWRPIRRGRYLLLSCMYYSSWSYASERAGWGISQLTGAAILCDTFIRFWPNLLDFWVILWFFLAIRVKNGKCCLQSLSYYAIG